MNDDKKVYTCQFCGFESEDIDDFEFDEKNKDGFWCYYCDGHTFFDYEKNKKRKFTLILEDKSRRHIIHYKAPFKFNKRLSPLRYPGGKSKLVDYIYSKVQDFNIDTFVEPYAGGSSVGLAFLKAGIINNLVINDKDYGVYALFTLIKENPHILINKIKKYIPTHEDYFTYQKSVLANYKNTNLFEAAWSLLVVNRLAYSGICKANPLGGKNGTTKALLSRWKPDELCKRILNINEMANKITVLNIDACELIEEMYWNPSTTILIDPPYFKKGKQLYNCYYNKEDHIQLSTLLDSLYSGIPGADIILTYDNDKFIKDIYLYPIIENISRIYSI